VTSSTLLADPPSNETIDVFYIKRFMSKRMPIDAVIVTIKVKFTLQPAMKVQRDRTRMSYSFLNLGAS